MSSRSARNELCISAAIERAQARVAASAGQSPGCRSARYSAIAIESHTTVLPSCSAGTQPDGENERLAGLRLPSTSRTGTSRNGAPASFIANQPRSDQEL